MRSQSNDPVQPADCELQRLRWTVDKTLLKSSTYAAKDAMHRGEEAQICHQAYMAVLILEFEAKFCAENHLHIEQLGTSKLVKQSLAEDDLPSFELL